jgi:uncharacterized protein (TIGR00369 family)
MNDSESAAAPLQWGPPRSKTITWYDPRENGIVASGLSGREFQEAVIDGRLPAPPIARLFGFRIVSVGDGEAVVRCLPDESTYNPVGLIHGGLMCTLLDTVCGIAVQTTLPPGVVAPTIEIKVSYLKAVRDDGREIECRGRALQVGRKVAFAEGHAYDADGTLLGHATTSLAVHRPSASE